MTRHRRAAAALMLFAAAAGGCAGPGRGGVDSVAGGDTGAAPAEVAPRPSAAAPDSARRAPAAPAPGTVIGRDRSIEPKFGDPKRELPAVRDSARRP